MRKRTVVALGILAGLVAVSSGEGGSRRSGGKQKVAEEGGTTVYSSAEKYSGPRDGNLILPHWGWL